MQAVNHCAQRIDSTRIGFIGHSFGAGAIPAFTWQCLMNRNWGKNGTFMFMMAPFYVFRIRQEQLEQFPGHVKLIIQVYEEDDCNDHRIAKDIFETINIDNTEKDFILMMSDSTEEYAFTADHGVPYGFGDENGEVDGLDFYGIYRLVDALAEYTFKKDQDAKEVALGNGNSRQRFMGEWPDARPVRELVISDTPEMVHHSKWYFFHWKHPWNPRRRKR